MSLEPETLPYQEKGSLHSLCWAHHLCRNIFPCFRLDIYSFLGLKLMSHVALRHAPCCILDPKGELLRYFHCCTEWGMCSYITCLGFGVDPPAMADWCIARACIIGTLSPLLLLSTCFTTWSWWTCHLFSGTSFHALVSSLTSTDLPLTLASEQWKKWCTIYT